MANTIPITTFIELWPELPVLDVRSPSEYEKGHIPDAINIPLFSDKERAIIGTAYKQESKERAIALGYEFVNPKLDSLFQQALHCATKREVIVHCWRGGMRSHSFANFLYERGFKKVYLIEGGYKAFRTHLLNFFEQDFKLRIIGGYTGSGKTEILHILAKKGEQIIDLEALANHRGSSFGGIDLPAQPSTEQFENNLFSRMQVLDRLKPIWIEDESKSIGKVQVPTGIFKQIRSKQVLFLDIPRKERVQHLVKTYSGLSPSALAASIEKIAKRLGYDQAKIALNELANNHYERVSEIALSYYDKSYLKGVQRREANKIITIPLATVEHKKNASFLLNLNIEQLMKETIKMTQYSHGAGCGCKISPKVLSTILESSRTPLPNSQLLVGNDTRDDAAVYDLGNGTAIISTTDFFLPIVDDPFTFGQVAATNAISDIYAMGGKPLLAIAILGWPVDKIAPKIAAQVMEGGRKACADAGIPLAGGHSIDNPEPIFGLAVTGIVDIPQLKLNNSAQAGSVLYLTKPLGIGILTTAQKKGLLKEGHKNIAINSMISLNKIGEELAKMDEVTALTDVTGFGLLGHLVEICEGSHLSAHIEYKRIPVFKETKEYIQKKCIPGGTHRNWESFGDKIQLKNPTLKHILCDPQTSGGLLIAVKADSTERVEKLLKENSLFHQSFGELIPQKEHLIHVIE